MKYTKKAMVATLMLVMMLAVGITPIFAQSDNAPDLSPNLQTKETLRAEKLQMYREKVQEKLQLATPEELDISGLDEADVDPRINDAREADAIDDAENAIGGLWILNAQGTTVTITPVTDAIQVTDRIGIQLIAEKVKNTPFGALYEVHWGRVLHDGEKVEVEGYALLDSDGVFYMSLDGEDLEFKSIGKIAPAMYGVRVAMKGYMTHDAVKYSHTMNGRAIPFGWFNRAQNQLRQKIRPAPNSDAATVEPTRNNAVTAKTAQA